MTIQDDYDPEYVSSLAPKPAPERSRDELTGCGESATVPNPQGICRHCGVEVLLSLWYEYGHCCSRCRS